MFEINTISILNDNYCHVLVDKTRTYAAVVDPGEYSPVRDYLDREGLTLQYILNTHHHWDHIGGNKALKDHYDCQIIGPKVETDRIPDMDILVEEGDIISFSGEDIRVIEVHGHTRGHIAYYAAESKALFSGDTLFSLGCGRLFEGTPEQMWKSLSKIMSLPDDTKNYCAHEYTLENASFALRIDPENDNLNHYVEDVKKIRAQGIPSIPSLLSIEKESNPFLRCDLPEFKKSIGMVDKNAVEVFAEIRRQRDQC